MARYTVHLVSNGSQLYTTEDVDQAAHLDAGDTIREALTFALQHKQGFTVPADGDFEFVPAELTHIYLFDGSRGGKDILTVAEAQDIIKGHTTADQQDTPEQAKSSTYTRTVKGTGETLTIGTAAELGVDAEAGKWATVCEDHHTVANSASRKLAYETRGVDFCDGCRTRASSNPTGRKVNLTDQKQAWAYAEGMKDGLDLLITALEEGGTVDHLLEVLEANARPEMRDRLNAFYANRRTY